MKILLAEDDAMLGSGITRGLQMAAMEVDWVRDGPSTQAALRTGSYQVLVLDIGLPGKDGLQVLQWLRASNTPLAVLVVSARDTVADRIAGLNLGADDYLTKPFGTNELLARIRVVFRHLARGLASGEPILSFSELTIDLAHRQVCVGGHAVHLTPKEYDLLRTLALQAGKVLTHSMLLRSVWGTAYEHDVAILRVFITQLRRKIEADPAHPTHILTESGVGYRFYAGDERLPHDDSH